jgi:Divergent InlB B-repeat domain
MRYWLLTLTFILSRLSFGQTPSEPFPDGPPVTFSFTETYTDAVVADPDFPGEFLVVPRSTLVIQGQAPLTAAAIADIDESSPYSISIGDFEMSGTFGEDDTFSPSEGDRSVNIIIEGFNDEGDFVQIGTVGISWTTTRVNFVVSVTNAPFDFWVASADYYPDIVEPAINTENMLAAFGFGSFGFDTRTVYMIGSASSATDPQERVPDSLSSVNLLGAIDSVAPSIVITQPATGVTGITVNDVTPDFQYTFTGTATDTRKIGSQTFPGTISGVEVRVGTAKLVDDPNPVWLLAQVDANGNWVLPNAQLEPGLNRFSVRVTDGDGNVMTTNERNLTLRTEGPLTVTAATAGYAQGVTGKAGTVGGSFFVGRTKKFDVLIGANPAPANSQNGIEAGQNFRVTAKPAPGSVFDGWVGTVGGVEKFTAVTETLVFSTRPNLVVTAKFVPNPFPPVLGIYQGLITGATPAERGLIRIAIAKTGAFSGKVQVGALTLPIKGKVLGSGFWTGTVTKKGTAYTVTFQLNVGASGDRQLVGTITGGGLDSSVTADLKDWRKPNVRKNDPGKTADAYSGTYNVLLPGASANTDPNFPAGIGFGQVKITNLGNVLFIGKLGDGSPAKASTILVKRNSGAVAFPLFIPLDRKLGNASGIVTYDDTQPDSDLAGTIEWVEPATKGTEPQEFAGQIDLHGSRYVKPAAPGQRIILHATGGNGVITQFAPAYSKPATPAGTPLSIGLSATLNAATQSVGPVGAELVQLKFKSSTGMFTGTFKDPTMSKTLKLSGIVSQKANGSAGQAGGVFIRGNRAGAVSFGPAGP